RRHRSRFHRGPQRRPPEAALDRPPVIGTALPQKPKRRVVECRRLQRAPAARLVGKDPGSTSNEPSASSLVSAFDVSATLGPSFVVLVIDSTRRSLITDGAGGLSTHPLDHRPAPRSVPRL